MTRNDVLEIATELLPRLASLSDAEGIVRRQLKNATGTRKLTWIVILDALLDEIQRQELVIEKIMGITNLVPRRRKYR